MEINKPKNGDPMTIDTVKAGIWMHHVTEHQGSGKNKVPFRVQVSSIKIWKRTDKVQICWKWGYRDFRYIVGTRNEVENILNARWRYGDGLDVQMVPPLNDRPYNAHFDADFYDVGGE